LDYWQKTQLSTRPAFFISQKSVVGNVNPDEAGDRYRAGLISKRISGEFSRQSFQRILRVLVCSTINVISDRKLPILSMPAVNNQCQISPDNGNPLEIPGHFRGPSKARIAA